MNNFEIYYTAAVVILMSIALIKEIAKPALIIFSALILLILGNVITVSEAFVGFSNHGMLTVGILFVVSSALQCSASFGRTATKILGNSSNITLRYLRLMYPVSFLSAFLNNTPIVATLIPVIKNWAKRHKLMPSKFLIPLSYAAILGGTCTLIGTSTNLVVHGLLMENGLEGFSFFELGKVGLPVAVLGILFFSIVGHRLLPSRKDTIIQLGERTREFVVEMQVGTDFPHIGKSIETANLRHLQGLFLFQIIRKDKVISSVSPEEKILVNDHLFFTGLPETIFELQKIPGLFVIKDSEFDMKNLDSDKTNTYEAVVSNSSTLVGQTVRESKFRDRYNAVILAVHRSGTRVNKKIGDIIIKPNDTLFIVAEKGFDKSWYHSVDFSLVSTSVDIYSKPTWKGNVSLILLIFMVLAAALKITSMLMAAAITAILMVSINIINPTKAKNSIDFDVLLIIASAFGIGKAMTNSGLADLIANGLINSLEGFGIIGIIAGIFFITSFYTELITNNAAAALIFPIALSTAQNLQIAPKPIMITIAIAASACFATPIGYQTNLMIYGPGGYKFKDFLKAGIPMNLLVGILVTCIVYFLFYM